MPKVTFSEEYLAELRGMFNYDPETGEFTRKDGRNRNRTLKDPSKTAKTYKQINANGVILGAHILAWWFMTGGAVPEGMEIDHKNRDKRDTRWENLRLRNRSGNASNLSLRSDNTSGITGVQWNVNEQRWVVAIKVQGVNYGLGRYTDFNEAVVARLDGELKYLGEVVSDYAINGLPAPLLPATSLRAPKPDERKSLAFAAQMASRVPKRTKPGAVGVTRTSNGRYQAKHRNKVIGTFDTLEQASDARESVVRAYYREVE